MLNLMLRFISEDIEAKAILFSINQGHQFMPEQLELRCIQSTFKHRVLHTLSMRHAGFRHLPQPAPSLSIQCIHIISHKNQHIITSFPQKRRIPIKISPNVPCQK